MQVAATARMSFEHEEGGADLTLVTPDSDSPAGTLGGLFDAVLETLAEIPIDAGGGSSAVKGAFLADLIATNRLERSLEIGVYRGRSFLPQALAFAGLECGEAIGVDPYDAGDSLQTDPENESVGVPSGIDQASWDAIHDEVRLRIDARGLQRYCRLVRSRSADAARQIADMSVDLLHIDGNHDRDAVASDLLAYLPKLKPGGFLVLDDASWESVRPHVEELSNRMAKVLQILNKVGTSYATDDFVAFRLPGPNSQVPTTTVGALRWDIDFRGRMASSEDQKRLAEKRADALEGELQALITSNSWRLTAPFRRLRRRHRD